MLPAYPKQNRLSLSPLGRHQVSMNTHTKLPSQARLKKKQNIFRMGLGTRLKAMHTPLLYYIRCLLM